MSAASYWELALPVSGDVAEGITNFLWELGALGVVEEQASGEEPRLRAFFPGHLDAQRLHARMSDYIGGLRALGFAAPGAPRVAPVAEANWAEAWREHFRPLRVGRRLLVAPPWDVPAVPGRLAIVIEPGRAFGTGHHGSTAGCLEALETIIGKRPPRAAIDLGTGSGILAIAAARLGVGRILAVDDDPDAVACATANIALNRVAERIACMTADAGALTTDPAPLVLANLLSAAHRRLAAAYARYVAPGGRLVLGGLLDGEAAGLGPALRAQGFAPGAARSVDGWTTLELRRTG
ncbi:MAG TPA: 50S ribosomal protein L11 methyltransferase [Methylomirabilota bacterium]|jgi:ribosomal protein L11 methyltransferase|nr:50S ribosomal protein L11 methyltransferase [Methylomirabilota bacterium]